MKNLYEITGNITDINTLLVNRGEYEALLAKLAELEAVQPRLDALMEANEKLQAHLHKKRVELERPRFNLDRGVMQQALDALEGLFGVPDHLMGGGGGVSVWRLGGSAPVRDAIEALRAELAKPEPSHES